MAFYSQAPRIKPLKPTGEFMKKLILVASMAALAPMASAKMLITVEGGVGYGFNALSDDSTLLGGEVDLTSSESNDGSSPYNLGMEADNGFYGWAKFSWPILPDVHLKYEQLVATGTATFDTASDIEFGDGIELDGTVDSELDLSYFDIGLTYGLPVPVVDIDFGLNFRSLVGGFYASSNGVEEGTEFTLGSVPLIIPMGYVSASGMIPGANVKLSGELSALPLGDSNVSDWNVKATWFAPLPTDLLVKVGLEAGYRNFTVEIGETLLGADTSELQSKLGFSGFFLGAAMQF